MYSLLKVGADVEVFLRNAKTNKLVIACGLIGGTKENPRKILEKQYSAVQEDNVMLEFNIVPAMNASSFRENINKVLIHTFEELEEKELVVDIASSRIFPVDDLKHPQAMVMGCDPDISAWSVEENPLINPERLGNLRTSGGHVHVTFVEDGQDPGFMQKVNLIRSMDLALGIPSVLLDPDNDRRRHYGRAGAFRNKGANHVEYRSLSNFWIKTDDLKEWVFSNTSWALDNLNSSWPKYKDELFGEELRVDIEKCIRTGDTILAKKLIREFKVPMPK